MNLYLVVSETLSGDVWIDEWIRVPEDYRIAELIIAKSRSQAKYLAWKNDKHSFTNDMRDMPAMQCQIKERDLDHEAGIVSGQGFPNCYWELS